jgi:hypothetical protein
MKTDMPLAHSGQKTRLPAWFQDAVQHRYEARLGEAVRACYTVMLAQPSPFVDPREQAFAAEEILPLLALYQALVAAGTPGEAAETEVRRLRAQALRERPVRGLWWSAHAPGQPFWRRRLVHQQVETAFPLPSFRRVMVEDAGDRLAFEVKRCPYRTAVTAYGVPELLPTFCRLDEVRFDVLANAVTCEHQQDSSGETCRFCFRLEPDTAALEDAQAYLEF